MQPAYQLKYIVLLYKNENILGGLVSYTVKSLHQRSTYISHNYFIQFPLVL